MFITINDKARHPHNQRDKLQLGILIIMFLKKSKPERNDDILRFQRNNKLFLACHHAFTLMGKSVYLYSALCVKVVRTVACNSHPESEVHILWEHL